MKKLNRYAGAAPFSSAQKEVFFGRSRDITQLSNLVLQEQQVLLYAKSGLGKSSLINAGLVPLLEAQHGIRPVFVRFGSYTPEKEQSLTEILLQSLPKHAKDTFLDKIIAQENSLWYHLKALQIENNTSYLLIFDQFEEVFTYPEEQVFTFKKQMAEMLYRVVPLNFKKVLDKKQAKQPDLITEEEWKLIHQRFDVKVLMAIREDKYSLLNTLTDYLPDVMHQCFGLAPLSRVQATEAITIPAKQKGDFISEPFNYTSEALEEILNFLTDGGKQSIETTQLQILCDSIEKLAIPTVKPENIPNFDNIFLEFYYDTLMLIPDSDRLRTQRFIENELLRKEQRISLDRLICLESLTEDTLDKLVNAHLLRAEQNSTGGISYEIAHDTLISPITEAKTLREAKEAQEKAEKDRIEEERRLKEQAEADRIEKLKIQKQLNRTRLLLTAAVIGLLIAVVAVGIAWQQNQIAKEKTIEAEKATLQARYEQKKSEDAEKQALLALDRFKTEKAKAFATQARNFLNMQEYEIAKANLDSAKRYDNTLPEIQKIEGEL
jgi:hypothetical protein